MQENEEFKRTRLEIVVWNLLVATGILALVYVVVHLSHSLGKGRKYN